MSKEANQQAFKDAYSNNTLRQQQAAAAEKKAKIALDADPLNPDLKKQYDSAREESAAAKRERQDIHRAESNFNKQVRQTRKDSTDSADFQNKMNDVNAADHLNKMGVSAGNKSADNTDTENKPAESTDTENKSAESTESSEDTENGGSTMGDKIKEEGKKALKQTGEDARNFSQSFYDTLSRGARGQVQGNKYDAKAATAKAQAQDLRNEGAHREMEAQRAQQIANQNPYAEAGKMASVQNDAENRQRVQTAGVLGSGAALARKTNTPDVQSQMQREDTQAQVAAQQREKADEDQRASTGQEGLNQQYKIESRNYGEARDTSARLSLGEGSNEEQVSTPVEETQEEEQPGDTQPEAITPEKFSANWQNVMNYMTYGNDPKSGWNPNSGLPAKPGRDEAKAFVEAKQWQPLSEEDVKNTSNGFDSPTGELQDLMSKSRGDFMSEWQNSSGRVKDGQQINQGDEGYDEAAQTNTEEVEKPVDNPPSDARIKNIDCELSDMRMKWIKEDWDRDGKLSQRDFDYLVSKVGPFKFNDREYDLYNEDDWVDDQDQTILKAYGDYIRNYVYTYKPEATEIDSSIDPNQEHIGPMAQDIEQVNPACVKETPEGVKTVDTARLAMMNAGAIGDLAREMQEIKARLAKLGV